MITQTVNDYDIVKADSLYDAIQKLGFTPPKSILSDRFSRFSTNDCARDDAGSCKLFPNNAGGVIFDFRSDGRWLWFKDAGRPSESELRRRKEEATVAMSSERARRTAEHVAAAERANRIWNAASEIDADQHPYLRKKGVKGHGARVGTWETDRFDPETGEVSTETTPNTLLVPIIKKKGTIVSLAGIFSDGKKLYLKSGEKSGCYFTIGAKRTDDNNPIIIAEGYATAATIHEATGLPVVVAFDRTNLSAVARYWRSHAPAGTTILIAADDDAWTPGNPGVADARKAAAAIGGLVAVPVFGPNRPEKKTDFNDLASLEGLAAVREQIEAARRGAVEPVATGNEVAGPAIEPIEAAGGEPAMVTTEQSSDWFSRLIASANGSPVPNLSNALLALRSDPAWQGVLAFDQLQAGAVLLKPIPRFGDAPAVRGPFPRLLADNDVTAATEWLQIAGLPRINSDSVFKAVEAVAAENEYHPIRAYLAGLRWDGVPRLSGWLSKYLGAEHTDYSSKIGTMFWIALVARVLRPGCKADYMLILEGKQGPGKSTACRIIAGDEYFSDGLPDNLHSKDASSHLRGKWLIEVSELHAMSKSESAAIKSFISRQEENYRPAYGRKDVREPRQCLFIGTTNKVNYLRDETGARRFWPVTVGRIDIAGLARDRDQIMAEAVHRFMAGESWWPGEAFEAEQIAPQQDARFEGDAWEDAIANFVAGRSRVTVSEVARDGLGIEIARLGTTEQRRISNALLRLGWERQPSGGVRYFVPRTIVPRDALCRTFLRDSKNDVLGVRNDSYTTGL